MIKDTSIIDLIGRLKLQINFNQVEIVDFWEGDMCAVGIKRGERLVYLSSYDFANDISDGYDYDLELLNEQQGKSLKVIKEVRNAKEEELIVDIKEFLEG